MDLIDYDKNKYGFNRVGAALNIDPIAWKISIPVELTLEEFRKLMEKREILEMLGETRGPIYG
ncbi:MAG: hypothetical protein E6151_00045 [Dialister micraerophilus]|nr:hypothetical protein [Dialister micraerophilus]